MEKGSLSLDAKKSSKYSKYSNKNCSIKKPKFHENLTLTYITKKGKQHIKETIEHWILFQIYQKCLKNLFLNRYYISGHRIITVTMWL